MWYKMENGDQRFVVGGLDSPVMFLGRLNTNIKSDLCRIIRLLQFVYLRWEYSLTLAHYNKCQYIDNMINYTDKIVKTNIRLRADLHFAFSRTILRELDQPITQEPQDAVGRCQQRPILRTRTARVRYGYPGCTIIRHNQAIYIYISYDIFYIAESKFHGRIEFVCDAGNIPQL